MNENESIYCIKCGKQLRGSAKFCNSCGTKVPVLDPPADTHPESVPQAAPQPVFTQQPAATLQPDVTAQPAEKKKVGKGAVFSLILAVIAATGLGVLIGICPEIYFKDDVFIYAVIGIGAVSGLAILSFILGNKNKAGVIGGILAVLTAALLCGYNFYYIPKCKEDIQESYMQKLRRVDVSVTKDTYLDIETYPYSSLERFYAKESKYREEVEDYLYKLYDKGEFSKWVAGAQFVNVTTRRGVFDKAFMDGVCSRAAEIDAYDLRNYSVLFDNNTPAGSVQTTASSSGAGRMMSDLKGRISQVENNESIIMSYGGIFYQFTNLMIYRDNYNGYVVVDLSNGNYFYNGDWL